MQVYADWFGWQSRAALDSANTTFDSSTLIYDAYDARIAKLERRIKELERQLGIAEPDPPPFTCPCNWECYRCPFTACIAPKTIIGPVVRRWSSSGWVDD